MGNRPRCEIIQNFLTKFWQTLLSVMKILLQSELVKFPISATGQDEIVVLGNGPSLRSFIENKRHFFDGKTLLAVNYAVLSDYYTSLKPALYVVADPAFFNDPAHCDKLFDTMATKTAWPLNLYLSGQARKSDLWQSKLAQNSHIKIHYFNMTPIEGFQWFCHWAFDKKWGSPRPRNVLIPSLMIALSMPFRHIYITGADHSWLKEIWVNDDNVVMEDLNHFYDKKGSERYVSKKHLHDLLLSMHIAFKSYHSIEKYSKSVEKKIYNCTEGSYIDAFERKKIEIHD